MQEYLDDAVDGAIYFSLGSNVKSILLDGAIQNAIIETFSNLTYKVLWKFEDENNTGGIPPNILIRDWFPQQAVLNHPNVKLFISQAGLQSTEEAIVSKVPILAIPFIFDQHYNAKRIEELGIGRLLNFETLNKENFKDNIVDLITNPRFAKFMLIIVIYYKCITFFRYKQTMLRVSEAMTDEPMSGLEKAVFWIEYVLRHKGAKYLKSPLIEIPWHRYLLVDVVTALLLICLVLCFSFYKIVVLLLRSCYKKPREFQKLKTG